MKKFCVVIFFLAIGSFAFAQDNSFLVYSFKGNVTVVDNKAETKARVGKLLTNTAVVKVPAGGTVTLICNEAAMFSFRKPGTYTLTQYDDSCKVTGGSVSANYVKYVWSQMTKTGGSPGSDRKKFMNTVGAVSRSVNNIWIDPRLDTVNYSGGDFPLSWKSYSEAKDFEFYLFNPNNIETPFFTTTVSKLKIPIPSIASKIKPGNSYLWTAAIKGEDNEELKVLNYVTKETFNAFLQNIKSSAGAFENAAEEAYRIAFQLEDAHYLSEAYQYYSKAATLAPDVPLYRSTLMSFKKDYEIK